MIDRVSVSECCICGACSNICPKQAISFSKITNGFQYPSIDADICINCNLCERVCPILNPRKYTVAEEYPKAFAARSEDIDTRLSSTSGAVFFEAGKYILSHGGYVCGTVFDRNFQVKHIMTNSMDELCQMRGSKYAQSDVGNIYTQIKRVLEDGKDVLFCGCPCQISALIRVLGKQYETLYLLDFVCHGIPSQSMLDAYLAELENQKKSQIVDFKFRDKARGWHNSCVVAEFKSGKRYSNPITIDPFMRGFHSGTTMKESCYHCRFKGFSSGSDLTLGDFWGAEVELKDWDDNTGISAVVVNTVTGRQLLEKIHVQKQEVDLNTIVKYNKNLIQSTKKNSIQSEFYEYANLYGSGKALIHFFRESKLEKLKRITRYQVKYLFYWLSGRKKPLY